ncbi:Ribosomal RNA small subunit methyltransferase D [Alkalibacterium sp. AK22]|nr:16S rRNA (guanine(966)-N(2))-methyltransferase RsmD [Alkalibacterium sp. AK22]EXJ22785.1 Ribosomal RNA small subunit methyltransferase D [Alkalibacterium sp. AK22]
MRVISGEYGGRRLKALKGQNTRPTTDKIKESLFHIIGPYFDGGKVLDLYSGSGSLGIEAVSRGMTQAYLVDSHPAAVAVIKENVEMTRETDKFTVWKKRDIQALEDLSDTGERFDLVLLDPPYAQQELKKVISRLVELNLLAETATVVCETDRHVSISQLNPKLSVSKEKVYGTSKITIIERVD